MIKSNLSITQVKSAISKLQTKRVEVTVNLGRNKFVRFMGVLEGVYPALFTVKPCERDFKGKTTYSYSEFMCGKVKLKQLAE